mgnify:FL=1
MKNKQYILDRATNAFFCFLTMCIIYAYLLTLFSFPAGLRSIAAVAGGALIGIFNVKLFMYRMGFNAGEDS